jgi:predicted NBD/HSP70 family sugar kinase
VSRPELQPSGGARQSSLRTSNLALTLRTICAAPLSSRADVAALTGMSRATASRLVDELVAAGLLDEVDRTRLARRGRPAVPLAPGTATLALGLQVDAGLVAARVLDLGGRVVAESLEEGNFVAGDPDDTLTRLSALTSRLLATLPPDALLVGAGLALPGLVDEKAGMLLRAPNLGWSDLRPADLLDVALPAGLELRLGNEADLAARSVADEAPGRPGRHRDFVYLSGQIGIGGAVVLAGQVMTGTSGWAGEIGHVCVDPAGPRCRCGSTGCLEQYAGRHALMATAGLPLDTPPERLSRLASEGDPAAVEALDVAARALGIALAGVINVLDLPSVVLGGTLGELTDQLRPALAAHLAARVLSARWRAPVLESAGAVPAAGATGAALRAFTDVLADPSRHLG